MKKIILIVFAAALFAGCATQKDDFSVGYAMGYRDGVLLMDPSENLAREKFSMGRLAADHDRALKRYNQD